MLTLASLEKGQRARVVEVHGEDAIATRIMEMGLIDGEPVQLIGRAPLGDPLEFLVRGYRLSLRTNEAQRVQIELTEPQPQH